MTKAAGQRSNIQEPERLKVFFKTMVKLTSVVTSGIFAAFKITDWVTVLLLLILNQVCGERRSNSLTVCVFVTFKQRLMCVQLIYWQLQGHVSFHESDLQLLEKKTTKKVRLTCSSLMTLTSPRPQLPVKE